MKYLKLFENFNDNKPVIDALEDILSCINTGKRITSKLNGGKLMDLHDKCDDPQVQSFLLQASEIAGEEAQGTKVTLSEVFDKDELEGIIRILKANPENE